MSDWLPIHIAPRDGTEITILWSNGLEDEGHWERFRDPQEVWYRCPWTIGQYGEWCTRFGNGDIETPEPEGWKPLGEDE